MNSLHNISGPSIHQNHLDHEFDPLVEKPEAKSDWVALNTPKNYLQKDDDLINFHRIMKRAVKVVTDTISSLLGAAPKYQQPKLEELKPRVYAPSGYLKQKQKPTIPAPITNPFQIHTPAPQFVPTQSAPKMQALEPRPYAPSGHLKRRRVPTYQVPVMPIFQPQAPVTRSAPKLGGLVDLSFGPKTRSQYPHSNTRLSDLQVEHRTNNEFSKMLSEMKNLERHIQGQDWYQDLMEAFPANGASKAEQE